MVESWLEPCLLSPNRAEVREGGSYFPRARRWKRVRFSIFLCFFLRIRLRRFLINDPMVRPR